MSLRREHVTEAAYIASHREGEEEGRNQAPGCNFQRPAPRDLLPEARFHFQRGPKKVLPAEDQAFKIQAHGEHFKFKTQSLVTGEWGVESQEGAAGGPSVATSEE